MIRFPQILFLLAVFSTATPRHVLASSTSEPRKRPTLRSNNSSDNESRSNSSTAPESPTTSSANTKSVSSPMKLGLLLVVIGSAVLYDAKPPAHNSALFGFFMCGFGAMILFGEFTGNGIFSKQGEANLTPRGGQSPGSGFVLTWAENLPDAGESLLLGWF